MADESAINVHLEEEDSLEDTDNQERRRRIRRLLAYLVVLVGLLLLVLYLAGLRSEAPVPPPKVSAVEFKGPWKEVTTVERRGSGQRVTDRFKIDNGLARITWSFKPTGDSLNTRLVWFMVNAKDRPEPYDNVVLVGSAFDTISKSWNLRLEKGSYYLDIRAQNADYKIKVEQAATPQKP